MIGQIAYTAMVREAQNIGYPEAYKDDLYVHDRAFCQKEESTKPFGWIVRKWGTHIMIPGTNWGYGVAKYYNDPINKGNDPHYFWFTGSELLPVTSEWMVNHLRKALLPG